MKKLFFLVLVSVFMASILLAENRIPKQIKTNLHNIEFPPFHKNEGNMLDLLLKERDAEYKARSLFNVEEFNSSNWAIDSGYYYEWDSGLNSWYEYGKDKYAYDSNGNNTEWIWYEWGSELSDWVGGEKVVYSYNINGNIDQLIQYSWDLDLNNWVESDKAAYSYDANGNKIEMIYYSWDKGLNDWVIATSNSKEEYSYDMNGNLTENIYYDWDAGLNDWVASSKGICSYDTNGNMIIEVWSEWDYGLNEWVEYWKCICSFDANGNETEQVNYHWDYDLNALKEDEKYSHSYDVNGNETERIKYNWDSDISDWIKDEKDTHSYDTNGNETEYIFYNWDSGLSDWIGYYKGESSYDTNMNMTDEVGYRWDSGLSDWVKSSKEVYYWSEMDDTGEDSVTFTYNGSEVTYGIVESNGRYWLDRNLGATQVATAIDDAASYGDLFQWGREDDGHQLRTSVTTATLAASQHQPGHNNFILNGSLYDWNADTSWITRWVDGIGNKTASDPCPEGWRVPTQTEWQSALDLENWGNNYDAFNSALKLPSAGYRYGDDGYGGLYFEDTVGIYWSSTPYEFLGLHMGIDPSEALMSFDSRVSGFSVRCIKDEGTNSSNREPELINGLLDQYTREDALYSYSIPDTIFSDPDENDELFYSATLSDGSAIPDWLEFTSATGSFSGTPANLDILSIRITAEDMDGLSVYDDFILVVEGYDEVTLEEFSIDTTSTDGQMTVTVSEELFTNMGLGENITYTATLEDGSPLPSYIVFDPETLTFTISLRSKKSFNEILDELTLLVTGKDADGYMASIGFVVEGEFLTDLFDIFTNIRVYPNPVNDKLIIENGFNAEIQIEIYDLIGKLVNNSILTGEINEVDLSSLKSSIYMMKIKMQGEERTVKIIKN